MRPLTGTDEMPLLDTAAEKLPMQAEGKRLALQSKIARRTRACVWSPECRWRLQEVVG